MISFPPLLPDELLYSVFARYHIWSGNENHRKTMRDLFGSMNVCAVTDLPCHLQKLSEHIPGKSVAASEILWNHTLLAYYAPFMELERLVKVSEEMLYNDGRSLFMKMGLPASGVKNNKKLQYCLVCAASDREQYGVAYWRRSHQLPGVNVCYKHHYYLCDSSVYFSQPRNKHQYISLDFILDTSNVSSTPMICNDTKEIEFAKLSHQLVNIGTEIKMCMKDREKMYMGPLNNKGFLSAKGRNALSRIIPAMYNFWGTELLYRVGSTLNFNSSDTWLHKVLRKQRHGVHPVRHLLLHGFLGLDIRESILETEVRSSHFGKAPWLCLNKAAGHYREPIIQEFTVSRCSKTGRPIGTFTCECGFIYSRRGPDKQESDKYRIGRIKKFGPIWMNKLKEISLDNSISLREKARQMGVDPTTIKNQLVKIELGSINGKNPTKRRIPRNRGKQSVNQKLIQCTSRINWADRDIVLADKIQHVVDKLKPNPKVRITLTEIGRQIGALALIQTSLNKLPKTENLLRKYVENTEQFQKRRVVIRTAELIRSRTSVKEWRVAKSAGLSTTAYKRMKSTIKTIIAELEKTNAAQ